VSPQPTVQNEKVVGKHAEETNMEKTALSMDLHAIFPGRDDNVIFIVNECTRSLSVEKTVYRAHAKTLYIDLLEIPCYSYYQNCLVHCARSSTPPPLMLEPSLTL
jgi:hypothetical protein